MTVEHPETICPTPSPSATRRAPGIRSGACWRRKGAPERALAGRETSQLVRDVKLTHRHTARRAWSEHDRAITQELNDRAWGVGELSRLLDTRAPRWVEPYCYGESGRHRAAWARVLGVLLACHAAGAAGLRLSYEEAAAEFGCSRRTWARWVKELLALELIAWDGTFTEADDDRERWRDRNLYRIGPKLDTLAALEHAPEAEIGKELARRAKAAAQMERRRAREWRRGRELSLRAAATIARGRAPKANPELRDELRRELEGCAASAVPTAGKASDAPCSPGVDRGEPATPPPARDTERTLKQCHNGTPTRPGPGLGFAKPLAREHGASLALPAVGTADAAQPERKDAAPPCKPAMRAAAASSSRAVLSKPGTTPTQIEPRAAAAPPAKIDAWPLGGPPPAASEPRAAATSPRVVVKRTPEKPPTWGALIVAEHGDALPDWLPAELWREAADELRKLGRAPTTRRERFRR